MIGRTVESSAAELTNQPKLHMKVYFRITSMDGKRALTRFDGFEVTKEYLYRTSRKRTAKLMITNYVETKDKWKLQITTLTVLNKKAETEIRVKVRKYVENFLKDFAGKASIDDFLMAVLEEAVQQHIRKYGSKIYPIRFNEISKIEVIKPAA